MEPVRRLDPELVRARTPDWYIYLRAAESGYHALVTRDWHQTELPEEMWVLSRLPLAIISWKKPMDDPVTEWGHLLAYLPELKRRIDDAKGRVILLPVPRLTADNTVRPSDALGALARERGIAVQQVRDEAKAAVSAWLVGMQLADRFMDVLQLAQACRNERRPPPCPTRSGAWRCPRAATASESAAPNVPVSALFAIRCRAPPVPHVGPNVGKRRSLARRSRERPDPVEVRQRVDDGALQRGVLARRAQR